MNNERNEMNKSNGEIVKPTPEPKTDEKRDEHDHLWIDLGGEG